MNKMITKRAFYLFSTLVIISMYLAMFIPRQLAMPTLYRAQVNIIIDRSRYKELYNSDGKLDADFNSIVYQAKRIMKVKYPSFGETELSQSVTQVDDGVLVQVDATSPTLSQRVIEEYADMLVLTIRAAGGREILRNLLGWELTLAVRGESVVEPASAHLREFLRQSIFTFNRPVEPVSEYVLFSRLNIDDQYDLIQAVEYRLLEIDRIEIPALIDVNEQTRMQLMRDTLQTFISEMKTTTLRQQFESSTAVLRKAPLLDAHPLPRYFYLTIGLSVLLGFLTSGLLYLLNKSVNLIERFEEIWQYRMLLFHLVRRSLVVRYKGTFLGFAWTQIVPIAQLGVYWFVFGYILKGNAIPWYTLFIICGLFPWIFTSESVAMSVRSVHDNANLVRQSYFPRELLPISSVLTGLVNFLFSLPVWFIFMLALRWGVTNSLSVPWTVVYFPIVVLVHVIFLIGLALVLTALALYSSDVIHIVGIFINIWFFLNPIVYSFTDVDQNFARWIRWFNPIASIIEFYREIVYGIPQVGVFPTPGIPATESMLRVLFSGLFLFAFGYFLFRRVNDSVSERL